MSTTDTGSSRRSHLLLGVGTLGYACFLFTWFSVAAFLTPLTNELGLSNTAAGILNGSVPLMYIPFALLSGVVIDRVGSRRAIGVGLLLVGLAHTARGMATTFSSMLAFTLVLGVSGTGITFGLPKLVSDLFSPERSGTMSSVYLIGLYAGTAAAFGLGRTILGPTVGGWRPLFVLSGLVTAAVAVCWFLLSWLFGDTGVSRDEPEPGTGDDTQEFTVGSVFSDVRRVITHRDLLLLVVIGIMYLFVTHGLQGWLTVILQRRGLSPSFSATITSGLIVAQLAGTLALPLLSDYSGRRRAVIAGCGVLVALGTFGLLFDRLSLVAVGMAVGCIGVGIGGLATLVRSLPLEMSEIGPRLAGTAVGFVFMFGEMGGFAGPFVIGFLEDVTGSYRPGLILVCAAGLVVIITAVQLQSVDSE